MRTNVIGVVASVFVAALGACVGSDPAVPSAFQDGGVDGGVDGVDGIDAVAQSKGQLSILPAAGTNTWTLGRPATLAFTLNRIGGFVDEAIVTVKGLPAGSQAAAVHVSATETSGAITVTPAADAKQGALVGATLEASDARGALLATAPLDVFLRGAPGDLDTSFATNGVLSLPGDGAMASAGDGRIYVLQGDLHAHRYTADGNLDPTFGNQGTAVYPIAGGAAVASARRVVVTANAVFMLVQPATTAFEILKSTLDGSLDATFGHPAGDFEASYYGAVVADGLAVRSNGSIAAVGSNASGNWSAYWVTPAGARDIAVNGNALSSDAFTGTRFDAVWDSVGLVLAAHNVIGRLLPAGGTYDATFGGTGKVNVGAASIALSNIALAGTKIVVAGLDTTTGAPFIARYMANAAATDPSFAFTAASAPFRPTVPTAFLLQTDGTMLLAGQDAISARCALIRYDANGKLDPSFGKAGVAILPASPCSPWSLAAQPDGKILVAGSQTTGPSPVQRVWN